MMKKARWIPIVIVIVIGIVLGGLILTLDRPSSVTPNEVNMDTHEKLTSDVQGRDAIGQPGAGPRGGKLFTDNGFAVELTIFEKGVPPQFRVYLYEKGK